MIRKRTLTVVAILLLTIPLACCARVSHIAPGEDEPAQKILELVLASQPTPQSLPEGSTYNYIWAENMMAWMAAEQCGYMSREETVRRLQGLLGTVADYETHHGFYFDGYDPATGHATTDKVYFQGWWLWALILTREAYPEAAPLAERILERIDYDAAGMVNADHTALAADVFVDSGGMSFWFRTDGDVAGELRTAFIAYTMLTNDPRPWLIEHEPNFIDVMGHKTLAVWHHFTFDPFYVHTCYPEVGYFAHSWDELIAGARKHREANGMEFFATRMEPLQAWDLNPDEWPNTEHRVAKPWNAWIVDPDAPVMELAWSPGYGVTQYFDNWNFNWAVGDRYSEHPNPIGSTLNVTDSRLGADFLLETLPGDVDVPNPPTLRKTQLRAYPDSEFPPDEPLIVEVNGTVIGSIGTHRKGAFEIIPKVPIVLQARNRLELHSPGYGAWRVEMGEKSYRPFQARTADTEWEETEAPAIEIHVTGQRAARENPYALLARLSGIHDFQVWQLMKDSDLLADRSVAWVGDYSQQTWLARIVHNVSDQPVSVSRTLKSAEKDAQWQVVDYATGNVIDSSRSGNVLHWRQGPRQTARLQKINASIQR
ncbi:hypothetical protein KQI84_17175 [bacterium]|nr:hypothetical protein [bacterium]